jgi:UDP-hydrolysing UDP-N-acetyl-D-glucosamine 2-epimerase
MRILAVTGSRADWGYLAPVLTQLRSDPRFDAHLLVTGQHLEGAEGGSKAAILAEGFAIDAEVPLDLSGDTALAMSEGFARCMVGCAEAIASLKPDVIVLMGDRYETLAAATSATMARVPIVHLCGGDVSEGAIDDAIRHAISKLAHLHFPTNTDAEKRLHQMGENPQHVHMVGSTGLDRLLAVPVMEKAVFFEAIGFVPRVKNLVVTIHPVTLASDPAADARALATALAGLSSTTGIIFTGTNIDPGYKAISDLITAFVDRHDNAVMRPSMGSKLYVNALRHCDAVVGNSSSGLYEAPSLSLPTVNIGIRQQGRLRAPSVIDCAGEAPAIAIAIEEALRRGRTTGNNPYGDGQASRRIVEVMSSLKHPSKLLLKSFHGAGP